jgi:hypothetical protein
VRIEKTGITKSAFGSILDLEAFFESISNRFLVTEKSRLEVNCFTFHSPLTDSTVLCFSNS